jgi:hypothetical protein
VDVIVGTPDSFRRKNSSRNSTRGRKRQKTNNTPSSMERLPAANQGENAEEDEIENTYTGNRRRMRKAGAGCAGAPFGTGETPFHTHQHAAGGTRHLVGMLTCHPAPAGTADCCHLPSHDALTTQTLDKLHVHTGLTTMRTKVIRI